MRTGIILETLSANQISYEVIKNTRNTPSFLFTKVFAKPCVDPACVVMDIAEIWDFNGGNLIATSFDTALFLAKSVNSSRKFYYVYDLDFPRELYCDPVAYVSQIRKLSLIARSEFHSDKLFQAFGVRPIGISPTFNLEIISGLCNKE